MKRLLAYSVLLLAFMTIAAAPQSVYVHSVKAAIMESPSMQGKTVATATRGSQLTVLGQEGRWYNVKMQEKTGWVSALLVRPEPPKGKASVFESTDEDLSKGSRRRASAVTSAAAARGLTSDDRKRLGYDADVDYESLEKIEAIEITEREVRKFLRNRD